MGRYGIPPSPSIHPINNEFGLIKTMRLYSIEDEFLLMKTLIYHRTLSPPPTHFTLEVALLYRQLGSRSPNRILDLHPNPFKPAGLVAGSEVWGDTERPALQRFEGLEYPVCGRAAPETSLDAAGRPGGVVSQLTEPGLGPHCQPPAPAAAIHLAGGVWSEFFRWMLNFYDANHSSEFFRLDLFLG